MSLHPLFNQILNDHFPQQGKFDRDIGEQSATVDCSEFSLDEMTPEQYAKRYAEMERIKAEVLADRQKFLSNRSMNCSSKEQR